MPMNVAPDQCRAGVAHTSSLHRLAQEFMASGGMRSPEGRMRVNGFRLMRVEAVVPTRGAYEGFNSRKERLAVLRAGGGGMFNRKPSSFNGTQLHVLSALRDRFHELPESDRLRNVRTFYCFHGCREGVLDNICRAGLVNLSGQGDLGYFGAGVYATLNLEYAARYAAGEFSTDPARRVPPGVEFPVVMLAACVGSAYPITPAVDYTHTNTRNRDKCNYFGETLGAWL